MLSNRSFNSGWSMMHSEKSAIKASKIDRFFVIISKIRISKNRLWFQYDFSIFGAGSDYNLNGEDDYDWYIDDDDWYINDYDWEV